KVFGEDLASNGFRDGYPKLVEARQTAEKGPPAELEKTPAAGAAAEKTKSAPAKTEPAKTEPAKTEPAKTEPAKTAPPKNAPAKTSALAPPEGTYPVGLVSSDDGLLLAQADSSKTTEAK